MSKVVSEYGPLQGLIGRWSGNRGVDLAPEEDGPERNVYHETIEFSPVEPLDNAGEQFLATVQYRQQVIRSRDGKPLHDQTGYWIWEQDTNAIMHSFCIPRGLALVAGGAYYQADDRIVFDVKAEKDSSSWAIAQSPLLQQKALTRAFQQQMILQQDKLIYRQTTDLFIYDQKFEHTDDSLLYRQL